MKCGLVERWLGRRNICNICCSTLLSNKCWATKVRCVSPALWRVVVRSARNFHVNAVVVSTNRTTNVELSTNYERHATVVDRLVFYGQSVWSHGMHVFTRASILSAALRTIHRTITRVNVRFRFLWRQRTILVETTIYRVRRKSINLLVIAQSALTAGC